MAPDLVELAVMDIVLAGRAVHVTLVQLHPQPGGEEVEELERKVVVEDVELEEEEEVTCVRRP